MNPLFAYYGSKTRIKKKIIATFPGHSKYIEAYAGTGVILFSKSRTNHQILNDLNEEIIEFFTTLKEEGRVLINNIESYDISRATFDWANITDPDDDVIERCTKWFWNNQLSFGGMGNYTNDHKGRAQISSTILRLEEVSRFLQHVEIMSVPAISLIDDCKDTLIYCDPPYYSDERVSKNMYKYEMTRRDHIELLHKCLRSSSMIAISGYNNPLYNDMLRVWNVLEIEANCSYHNEVRTARTEVLWTNYHVC